jgi:hypothetical protein
MEELQIAKAEAEVLNMVSNWGYYSTFDGSSDLEVSMESLTKRNYNLQS